MKNDTDESSASRHDEDEHLDPSSLEAYALLLQITHDEGSELWSRFNIIASVNLVFLGAIAFIATSDLESPQILVVPISAAGVVISSWSVYVLRRLWLWHGHYKDSARKLEKSLASGIPRILTDRPKSLQKKSGPVQAWLLDYTQPFMVAFTLMWIAILVVGLFFSGEVIGEPDRNDDPMPLVIVLDQEFCASDLSLAEDLCAEKLDGDDSD